MSSAGLEVYNSNGTIRNTISDRFGRIVGMADFNGYGTTQWPYPNVVGKRAVYCISNLAPQDNVFSNAYAVLNPDNTTIRYGTEGDRRPITIVFMVY